VRAGPWRWPRSTRSAEATMRQWRGWSGPSPKDIGGTVLWSGTPCSPPSEMPAGYRPFFSAPSSGDGRRPGSGAGPAEEEGFFAVVNSNIVADLQADGDQAPATMTRIEAYFHFRVVVLYLLDAYH
jgi:hypothetical protein